MRRPLILVAFVFLVEASLVGPVAAQAEGDALHECVRDLSRHGGSGRETWIAGALKKLGCAAERQQFLPARGAVGTNLVVTFGTGGPTVVLTAHMDCVGTSPGANDNASGCAVLLRLAADLHGRKRSGEEITRKVVLAFLDQGIRGRGGSKGLLESIADDAVLACLNLDAVGSGDTLLFGPVAPEGDDLAMQLLRGAVEGVPEAVLPRAALLKTPPGDHQTFRRSGLDAATLMMIPEDEVPALREYLQWKRRPGEKRPPRPPTHARAGSPKDRLGTVSKDSLATALRMARRWLELAIEAPGAGHPVRADYAASCRKLERLLSFGVSEGLGARKGSHVDLLAAAGPRGVFRTVLAVVAADGASRAHPAVRRVLETFLAGPRLRGTVRSLFDDEGAPPLEEGLRDLYRRLGSRMLWNPEIPGIVLRQ